MKKRSAATIVAALVGEITLMSFDDMSFDERHA